MIYKKAFHHKTPLLRGVRGVFLLLIFYSSVSAQKNLKLNFVFKDSTLKQQFQTQEVICKDTLCIEQRINLIFSELQKEGYLTCQIDTICASDKYLDIFINEGKKYAWAKIRAGNVDENLLKSLNIHLSNFNEVPINITRINAIFEKIITFYENNGFPFAGIQLDSIVWRDSYIESAMHLQKKSKVTIDSIKITGDVKVNPIYLYNYIELKPGDAYQEQKIKNIKTKLDEWTFASLKKSPFVIFTKNTATLELELAKKKSSNFQGILGVLPNSDGKITITGDARIRLENTFFKGESFNMQWKRIQNNTQNLNLKFAYPYLLNTRIGVASEFDLFRKDTTFSNLQARLALQYLFTSKDYFQVFINQKTSSLLSTQNVSTIASQFLDISLTSYGIGFVEDKLDYKLNPRKGIFIDCSGSVGNKVIKKNPRVRSEVYDSLKLKTLDINTKIVVQVFIPVTERFVIKTGVQDQRIINENLFENEFFRIGGLFTLRGFDEESIYASSFSIATFEPRFILEKNSYLYVFFDGAYYQNNTKGKKIEGYPFGFGAGISFETKPGIFTFTYALGRNTFYENGAKKDSGFSVRAGKVHFGFINYF